MSDESTLNSRLRKLVAKTFRAEQLYSSMRNASTVRADTLASAANDLRAREWQQAHSALRAALNEALSLTSRNAISTRVAALQQQFELQARDASSVLESGTARLVETSKRQEFVHVLKLGFELIQQKARAQAAQVICDELKAVITPAERSSVSGLPLEIAEADLAAEVRVIADKLEQPATNVIPLRRQAGGRTRQE